MIKIRDAGYCNLKLLLIWLVVLGHLLEPFLEESPAVRVYKWIYLFHMPLFAFLSGCFLRGERDCRRGIRRLLPVYLAAQAAAVLLGHRPAVTPWWYLWYLPSCCAWYGAAWVWFRRGGPGGGRLLLGSLGVSLAAGFLPALGRPWSLSRTLVLFPFFWAGVLTGPRLDRRRLGPWALGTALPLLPLTVWLTDRLPVQLLYHAGPYQTPRELPLRLLCLVAGAGWCLVLLAFVPGQHLPCSAAGADTLTAYLCHGGAVLLFRALTLPPEAAPLAAAAYLYWIHKLTRWHGALYGIRPGERREGRWPDSSRSTGNTRPRSTGFC